PYDDPVRARKFLRCCADSAVNFARALAGRNGGEMKPGPRSIPDDFAGMFPPPVFEEFVVPAWERMYAGLQATVRHLHSELLRPAHLKYLADLRIAEYDPSADQYLTPEVLAEKCPVRFTGRIQSWHIRDLTSGELRAMYRRIAACWPTSISFYMTGLSEEDKIRALLETARELAR
ncbi:MAG: uroporphyrinogen decarboxylase family protein, partial [Planctomycetota bacterium]|nr:uroporphyrinogen decarboxylase family protein [Planctomycetota bacterium]